MRIALSAESTIDLPSSLLKKFDIHTLPFSISLGDRVGFDGEITTDEIIEYVNITGNLPKTGAVNMVAYQEHFESLLKEYDAVIHFSLSSELSLACTNAINTARDFKNVFVVDTRTLSTGIALLCLYARDLIEEGYSAEEIYNKCLERIPSVQASFVLKRLDYLHKGGRCSSIAYFGANILKIRPQIIVKDGKMISGKKFKGKFESVALNYCRDVLQTYNTPDKKRVFLTYTTAEKQTIDDIVELLKEEGFEDIMITRAGGTITSHCGENCLGILYINDAK